MKWGGYWCIVLFLILIGFLIWPAQADMPEPTITHVFFQKDGSPYNESVVYTVQCYGFAKANIKTVNSSNNLETVFEYSATCHGYGCSIWEPYYRLWWNHIDHCDVQGEAAGRKFIIRNISLQSKNGPQRPVSKCVNIPANIITINTPWNTSEFYYQSPEWHACKKQFGGYVGNYFSFKTCDKNTEPECMDLFECESPVKILSNSEIHRNKTVLNPTRYMKYLETCNPSMDPDCPGWIIDGKPIKNNWACRPNESLRSQSSDPCITFLIKSNLSLAVSAKERKRFNYGYDQVQYICYSEWTIPSDDEAPQETANLTKTTYTPQSPVASLYCSIVSFLGGRCE